MADEVPTVAVGAAVVYVPDEAFVTDVDRTGRFVWSWGRLPRRSGGAVEPVEDAVIHERLDRRRRTRGRGNVFEDLTALRPVVYFPATVTAVHPGGTVDLDAAGVASGVSHGQSAVPYAPANPDDPTPGSWHLPG